LRAMPGSRSRPYPAVNPKPQILTPFAGPFAGPDNL